VSKDPIGCSDTKISEGVVAVRASVEDEDTAAVLSENLCVAGDDLPDPEITEAFAEDTRPAYDWLRRHGLRPSVDEAKGKPEAIPLPLGGHTHARSIGHPHGGIAIGHAAWNAVVQGAGIDYLEDAWFLDVVTTHTDSGPVVAGGVVYDAAGGRFIAIRAPAVIVASGGLNTLYFPRTDAMRGNTGDSYALAARAGADLVDMEQVQFLPFCITHPPAYEGLLAGEPGTAGFLGVLRDADGKVILDGVMLRTRAECSAAIVHAVAEGRGTARGGCYLDLTDNVRAPRSGPYFEKFLHNTLPRIMVTVRQAMGRKAAKCQEPWEVRPGAHYCMGGIRVDANGAAAGEDETRTVHGLFAAGQAMGGVFGSNRLGSTSLAEGAIFGARSGRAAAALARPGAPGASEVADDALAEALVPYRALLGRPGGAEPEIGSALVRRLQAACWDHIGPARTGAGLESMKMALREIRVAARDVAVSGEAVWNQSFIDLAELQNMLDTAEATTTAAQNRTESVGAHVRLDGAQASLLFARPYTVAVRRSAEGAWSTARLARPATPLRRLLGYLARDRARKIRIKLLRLLPLGLQDRILEKRYRTAMGDLEPAEAAGA
jgi:succinate dehydrogenase/fumarate reductase flavoprotein subunit